MTTNPRSREAAYADLVSGLIDARIDVASERFDTELEAAEASGRLDPATARLIRWWQRESVRAVTEHARTTIPVSLVALEKAATESREAVNRADAAWTTARGVSARATYATDTELAPPVAATAPRAAAPVAPPVESAPAEVAAEVAPPAAAPPAPAAPVPAPPAPPMTPAPPAPPTAAPRTLEPPGYPSDPIAAPPAFVPPAAPAPPAAPPAAEYPPAPDEAPAIVDLTTPRGEEDESDQGATPAGGRRRTLLAGLTVLPRSD